MDTVIQILLATSFLLHGVFKNFVIGGVPIIILTYYRGRDGDGNNYYLLLAKSMSQLAPTIMTLAVVFGLVAWAILTTQYEWTLSPFWGSAIGGWVLFLILLLLGFWGMMSLKRGANENSGTPWAVGSLVTCCMIAIVGVFVASHLDMLTQSSAAAVLPTQDAAVHDHSTFLPRFFHSLFSSVAMTGMALTIYGSLRPQCQEDRMIEPAPYDIRLVRYGVGWVLGGTVPQVVVGPWFMLALPSEIRFYLIDGTNVASLIFFVSLTLTLLSLVLLNSSLLVPQKRGLVWGGVGSLVLTIVFMVLVREEVRKIWLLSRGESVGVGELTWVVVISALAIMSSGLYLVGRYVTLTHDKIETC